ncbi:hypothetical protein D3C72_2037820 [compost metagenome]
MAGSVILKPVSWMCSNERQSKFWLPMYATWPSTARYFACTMPLPVTLLKSMRRKSRFGIALICAMVAASDKPTPFWSSRKRIFIPRWPAAVRLASTFSKAVPGLLTA